MRKMSGVLGLTLLVLLLSPATSEALWPEKKPATAGETAKEYVKGANQATTDAAGAVKDAASRGAQTVTGGRQDHGSTGATGAAYRDATGRYVADSASATHGKAAQAAEAVKDTVSKATQTVADTTRAVGEKASDAATATKDAAVDTAQVARDKAAQSYDASADTVGSTRDRVWGTPDSEKTYTQRAQDHTAYAGEKLSGSAQAAADAAQRGGQNARDSAARAYDSTTNTLGTPVKDQGWGHGKDDRGIMDKAGDHYQGAKDSVSDAAYRTGDAVSNAAGATKDAASRTGEATRDTAYRTMGYEAPSDKGYTGQAYDSARDASSSAYETGRNKLGNIIEVLGWHRAAEGAHTKNSPYDVLVGNTRYVWPQHSDSDDSYYQKAKDTFGGATETTSDKASQAKNAAYDSAGRAKDAVVDTANRASESVKEKTGQSGKAASDYSQRGKEALGAGAAAMGAHKLAKTPKKERASRVLRFLHLLAYAVTFGSAVWMTFISGRILSRTIPREQFRTVQTRMFPYFLKFMVVGEVVLAVLSSLTSRSSSKWSIFGFLFLIAATAFNAFVLEPKTTKIYLERLRMEKEEGRAVDLSDKQQKFNEVHGFSALLNLLSVAGLTLHGWHMVPSLSS